MPRIGAKGAQSSQGFGQFALSTAATYIEDVFSTYLYTGNSTTGGTQTITNNIDLSTQGGMVWIKGRSAASDNILTDTTRGAGASATNNNALSSNLTSAEDLGGSSYDYLSSFSTTGFVVTQGGTTTATRGTNYNAVTYTSWTFRKQPKFFDVVTYTGNGVSSRTINHNLGVTPGFIVVKRTNSSIDWVCYHVSTGAQKSTYLNSTVGQQTSPNDFPSAPTASSFTVGNSGWVNDSFGTYVAYLFAHDAGGFGLTGTDNVISCGSYTGNGSATGPTITLGYEPQFVMVKASSTTGNWVIEDTMRGMSQTASNELFPNLANAETALNPGIIPNATGFSLGTTDADMNSNGVTYIYIAIRRGPMKTPTSGTSVFAPVYQTSAASPSTVTTNFPVDLTINTVSSGDSRTVLDRLRGGTTTSYVALFTNATSQETVSSAGTGIGFQSNTAIIDKSFWSGYGLNAIYWNFRRAPGFFDEVCYTGTGASTFAVTHNLGVKPELAIIKCRSAGSTNWIVGVQGSFIDILRLNTTAAILTSVGNSNFTSTTFVTGSGALGANETTISSNGSGNTYVAYLFATAPGVSKVGSYTGNGSSQTINSGFTGGARFVLIKRTDSTGDWVLWDSSRGMVAGTDPRLALNSTAAEVNQNWVYTTTGGFQIVTSDATVNASGGSYIYLSIA